MYFDSVNAALTMEPQRLRLVSYVITFLVLAFMLVQPLLRGRRLAGQYEPSSGGRRLSSRPKEGSYPKRKQRLTIAVLVVVLSSAAGVW